MKRSTVLALFSIAMLVGIMPSYAQGTAPANSDNKVVSGVKAVGRGIMWGPKKLWSGMKAVGTKLSGK